MHQIFREDIEPRQYSSAFRHPPGETVTHPRQVVDHPALSRAEKRALLAEWASDACAVEGRPAWRQIPGSGALVIVDDVLAALQALDRDS